MSGGEGGGGGNPCSYVKHYNVRKANRNQRPFQTQTGDSKVHNLSASGQTKRVVESKCVCVFVCVCLCVC